MLKIVRVNAPAGLLALVLLDTLTGLVGFYVGLTASWVDPQPTIAAHVAYLPRALLFVAILLLCLYAMGVYQRDVAFRLSHVLPRLLLGGLAALALLGLVSYAVPNLIIWRSVVGPALPIAIVGIAFVRLLTRHPLETALFKRRVVVLGAGRRAERIEMLAMHPHAHFLCLACVPAGGGTGKVGLRTRAAPTNDLPALIQGLRAEQIVLAPEAGEPLPTDALIRCRLHGVDVVDYQSFFAEQTGRVDLDSLTPEWFFVGPGFRAAHRTYRAVKRTIDLGLGLALGLLLAPLAALAALAIWLEDRGPVVYAQERIGIGGRPFTVFKLRSMPADAEADGVPRWSDGHDGRPTRVGRILRRTKLDEVPQLWNVLGGDMSFVGPRPERPHFVERLSARLPFYQERHAVKPGLTGWAQVNLPATASEAEARRKLEFDLHYVKSCGPLLDLLILLQTLRAIVWPEPTGI